MKTIVQWLAAGVMAWTLVGCATQQTERDQLEAQLKEARTMAALSAENTKRYQDTYSDIYFQLNSLTVANFEQRVQAGETLWVYIGRPSCGDCNTFEPLLKRYIVQHGLQNKIWFVNVHYLHQDKTAWTAFKQRYGIAGTPVLVKFAAGKPVNKLDFEEQGGITAADLENWLRLNRL